MAIGVEQSYLLGTILAAAFYGVFTVLYGGIVYIIFFYRKDSRLKRSTPLIIVTVMFIVATLHLGVTCDRTRTAIILKVNEPGGAIAYLNLTSVGSYMFQDSICAFQTLMADSFIVYRLYVVYSRDKRVVIPAIILLIGSAVTATGALVLEGLAEPGTSIFTSEGWITTFFTLTFVTNFSCTGLIAYKIWKLKDALHSMGSSIAVTVIESGALYSVLLIFTLVTYATKDWSFFIPFSSIAQIIGIAFSLILIRVSLGISLGDTVSPILTTIVSISTVEFDRETGFDCETIHGLPSFGTVHTATGTEAQCFGLDTISEGESSNEKLPEVDNGRGSTSSLSGVQVDEQKTVAL